MPDAKIIPLFKPEVPSQERAPSRPVTEDELADLLTPELVESIAVAKDALDNIFSSPTVGAFRGEVALIKGIVRRWPS